MPTPWKTPYENLPAERRFNLSIDVDLHDHRLIKSVTCTHGAITKFIQTIYHDIAEYARANDLTLVDSDAFLDYLRKRADSRFAGCSDARDGRDAAPAVHNNPPDSPVEQPNTPKAPVRRQRNRKA